MNTKKLFPKKVTVEDIHKDFKTVADAVVTEAQKASVAVDPPKKPEILERYEKLGLKNNKHVKEFAQAEDAFKNTKKVFDKQQRTIKVIEYYRVLYPANPFIPHQNLLDLCQKYGLVFNEAEYFTEDIPLNCLEAMEKFEWKDADLPTDEPVSTFRSGGTLNIKASDVADVNWHPSFNKPGEIILGNAVIGTDAIDALASALAALAPAPKLKTFHIVGTRDMFKLPSNHIWDDKKHTSVVDDPIVLAEVKHGWLVIAAWGPEAELPEINIFKQ